MAPYPQVPDSPSVRATSTPMESSIRSPGGDHPRVWIIPTVVGGGIAIMALLVWALLIVKRRQQYEKARSRDPYLTRPEFSRMRKMSAADRLEEEEKQRIIMIRKSLASRSWGSESDASRRTSQVSHNSQTRPIPEDPDEEDEPAQLREDWKAWEARMQRSATLEQHPVAADGAVTLAMPQPSRSRSPSRSPLLKQSPGTPPRSPRLASANPEQT